MNTMHDFLRSRCMANVIQTRIKVNQFSGLTAIHRHLAQSFAVIHISTMSTARAIIFSALLLAVSIGGATWYSTNQRSRDAEAERYQLANTGGGSTVRLDRQTGDMITCRNRDCVPVVKGGKIAKDEWAEFPAVVRSKD